MTCSLHLWIWDVLRISFASMGVLMITIVVDWALSTEFYQNRMYFSSYNHTLKMFGGGGVSIKKKYELQKEVYRSLSQRKSLKMAAYNA